MSGRLSDEDSKTGTDGDRQKQDEQVEGASGGTPAEGPESSRLKHSSKPVHGGMKRARSMDSGSSHFVFNPKAGLQMSTSNINLNYKFFDKRPKNHMTIEIGKDEDVFVEMPDLKKCFTKLLLEKLVVITGPPGQGKKTLANALCRKMLDTYKEANIKLIVINSWDEWDIDEDLDKAQVVLIKNMFGSTNVRYVDDWIKIFHRIEMCIAKSDKLFHIVTCKIDIYKRAFSKIKHILKEKNLFKIEAVIGHDNRKNMISKHARRAHLELEEGEIETLSHVADNFGFPKSCRMFLDRGVDKNSLPLKFQHPTEVYMDDLAKVPRKTYAFLLLLLLEHPRSTRLESATKELTHIEKIVLSAVGVLKETSFLCLLLDARNFEDVYILEDHERKTVDFCSDNILYSVVKLFYVHNAEFILTHCPFELLERMVRVETQATPVTVVMKTEHFTFLADRFLNMLLAGEDMKNICLHPAFQSDIFTDVFFVGAGNNLEKLFTMKDPMKGQTWLYWSIWSESGCLCRMTLSRMESIEFKEHTISKRGQLSNVEETILAACVSRNRQGLMALLKYPFDFSKFNTSIYDTCRLPRPGSQEDMCLVTCDSFLEAACRYGTVEILDILMERNQTVVRQEDVTSLFIKCVQNNMPIALDVLLSQLTKNVWFDDELQSCLSGNIDWNDDLRTPPLHYAIRKKFQDVARSLLQWGSRLESIDGGMTAAQTAWQTGNIEIFEHLVECGADFTFNDNSGLTPLHCAFRENKRDLFLKMLVFKPDVNFIDNHYRQPIIYACQTGDVEMAKALVDCRCDVNVKNLMQKTPLHLAILREDTNLVSLLCSAETTDLNVHDDGGSTALHLACDIIKTNFPHITELLRFKPQLDVKDNRGRTPLHIAWKRSNIPLIQELLQNGANHRIQDENENTLVHYATEIRHMGLLKTLLGVKADMGAKNELKQTPVHIACLMQSIDVLDLLLTSTTAITRINMEDKKGNTPLQIACKTGNIYMALLLIRKGAEINNGRHSIPVQIAWKNENQVLFKELISNGGFVDIQHPHTMCTPLHDSCEIGDEDMVRFLLGSGADVDICDIKNQTALHICCNASKVNLAEMVISSKNINSADAQGKTSLYRSCETGNVKLVKFLLSRGASIKTRNDQWASHPMSAAMRSRNYESIFSLLKDNGFDINELDDNGESLLYVTCRRGSFENVQKLLNSGARPSNFKVHAKSPFLAAIDSETIFDMLLKEEGNHILDKKDNNGDHLLHYLCTFGEASQVKTLLARKSNVNARSQKQESPVHIICKLYSMAGGSSYNDELLRALLNAGAEVNTLDVNGSSPIHILSRGINVSMVETLLDFGADVNQENREHLKPIHIVLQETPSNEENQKCQLRILKSLLEAGADVNAPYPNDILPVHKLTRQNRSDLLEILLQFNVALDILDEDGDMPVHVACKQKNAKIVDMLLEKQDFAGAIDIKGRNPLHVACEREAMNVIDTILARDVDVEVLEKDGERMAIDIAVSKENSAIAEKLLARSNLKSRRLLQIYKTCKHKETKDIMRKAGMRMVWQTFKWLVLFIFLLFVVWCVVWCVLESYMSQR